MKKNKAKVMPVLFMAVFLAGCGVSSGENDGYLISEDETYDKQTDGNGDYRLTDKASLYEEDGNEVVTMYLTVGSGNEADGTDHSWEEVNSYPLDYYSEKGLEPYKCEAVLQVGDDVGPVEGEFGYGIRTANATVQLRGSGASQRPQKSYRIRIKDGCGRWRDQKTISLNKHVADPVRFKNRLAYDLMEEIPQMLSCRTTFVHLYVKDRSDGNEGLFQDYGLYTQVEQINKTYLKNRGFDKDGQLYQTGNEFDWGRHEDSIMSATAAGYDQDKFEEYLEIEGSEDHEKIVSLLEAVNDPEYKITDIVDKYFERENLYYWMAFHILTGNKDVLRSGYYLYSPRGSDRWYFISWNNDGILNEGYEQIDDPSYERSWNKGIYTFADNVLFKRILQDGTCRQELNAAVEDLYANYLTEEKIQKKIIWYENISEEYLYSLPDRTYVPVSKENYDILTAGMAGEISDNYAVYKETMESAWPFHILDPVNENGQTVLCWEQSFISGDQPVEYTVEVAKDYTFRECIVSVKTGETQYAAGELPAGQYFVRIHAAGPNGITEDAYEFYNTENSGTCYSTLCFYVFDDGSVEGARFSEDEQI